MFNRGKLGGWEDDYDEEPEPKKELCIEERIEKLEQIVENLQDQITRLASPDHDY